MKRSVILALTVLAISMIATSSFAITVASTNSGNVTANVVANCQWTTPLTMAFGPYDPFAASALTASTSVSFNCIKRTNASDTYKVWFSKTSGSMAGPSGDVLAYTLTHSGAALPTAVLTAATVTGNPGVGAGTGYTYAVDGAVAAGQNAGVGSYADTVVANIEY